MKKKVSVLVAQGFRSDLGSALPGLGPEKTVVLSMINIPQSVQLNGAVCFSDPQFNKDLPVVYCCVWGLRLLPLQLCSY